MFSNKQHCLLGLLLVQQMFVAILSTSNGNASCARTGVGTCVCKWTGPFCTVICKGLEFVPENLPVKTIYLTIIDGTIKEIPDEYFLPLKTLQKLDLKHNRISKTFQLPKSIRNLDLSYNLLNSSLLYGIFDGLTKLRKLDISFNPINGSLIPGTFSSLNNLETLDIQQCHLKDIVEGTFAGLSHLQQLVLKENDIRILRRGSLKGIVSQDVPLILNVYSNNISHIEDGTFEEVQKIGTLSLDGNRLKTLPDLRGLSQNVGQLKFVGNEIEDISSLASSGIKTITDL